MQEPLFKPTEWVRYELEDGSAGFGSITGAVYTNNSWNYIINGTTVGGEKISVTETAVKYLLENNNWTAPTNFAGSNSAYANVEQ